MSNQESVFAGPEQQYPDPRMVNNDAREQQRWQMGGEKLHPQQTPLQPRRRSLLVAIAVIAIVLVALWYMSQSFLSSVPSSASHSTTQSFQVFAAPTLVIIGPAGSVHIHRGKNASQVTVGWSITHFGFGVNTNNIKPALGHNGDTITVTVPETSVLPFSGTGEVNLDISVPQQTNVQLNDESGSVDIEGLNGQINAQTGSGEIHVRDVAGQLTLQAGSGDINLTNARLSGQSTLNVGSGSIHFDGTLDRNGTYDFEAGSGTITVTLPADSAFRLKTATGSGVVNNGFGNTDVGSDPRAHLTLRTGSGSIDIQKKEA